MPREHGFEPLTVEGNLPADLRGTLYRNGPGLFGQFGQRYSHPFEGDGAILAVRLDGTRALGAHRLVQSAGLAAERAAGRLLYGFSVPRLRRMLNVLRRRGKNTANTNVIGWQGRLYAMMEGAKPTQLDPDTLETIGESDLDGAVLATFSAHPHRVAAHRATYNFGLRYGRQTELDLFVLPDVGRARRLATLTLPAPVMLHDFIATETHLVFFVAPATIDVRSLFLGGGFDTLVQWRPELGTEVIAVPLADPSRPVRFTVPAFYQWHFANAFARGTELVVDYAHYTDVSSFHELGRAAATKRVSAGGALSGSRYHRATIDIAARRFATEPLADGTAEFPRLDPRVEGAAHRYTWIASGSLDVIARIDTQTGARVEHRWGPGVRITEPVFVPRATAAPGDELDGHVLAQGHDGGRDQTFLAIYDARAVDAGPVARAWFSHFTPITFHGNWVAAQ